VSEEAFILSRREWLFDNNKFRSIELITCTYASSIMPSETCMHAYQDVLILKNKNKQIRIRKSQNANAKKDFDNPALHVRTTTLVRF